LWLHDNQFSGSIPASLGDLSFLTELWLQDNQFSGSIPSSLGDLSALRVLYLNNNQLNGTIPSSLGKLLSLQFLLLDGNQLSGSIPASVGGLSSLIHIFLNDNQLSGQVPSSLGELPNLSWCNMLPNDVCREESFIECGTDIPGMFYSSFFYSLVCQEETTTVLDADATTALETTTADLTTDEVASTATVQSSTISEVVHTKTDCEIMNAWLPLMFNATGTECCSQAGIKCVSDRITEMYATQTKPLVESLDLRVSKE
jgi:hypothetical protein